MDGRIGLIVIVLTVNLAACGGTPLTTVPTNSSSNPNSSTPTGVIPQDFISYVQQFEASSREAQHAVTVSGINMEYATLQNNIVGYCKASGNNRLVQVDQSFWNRTDQTMKQILIDHELGH